MKSSDDNPAGRIVTPGQSSGLRIEVIDSLSALEPYRSTWDCLALEAPQKFPTLSHAWVVSYLENFLAPEETWRCILAFDDDHLVGLLPVIITPYRIAGLSRPRLSTPHDEHTSSIDFLAAVGRENEVIPLLLSTLLNDHKSSFEFSLTRLPDNSPTLTALAGNTKGTSLVQDFNGYVSYIKIEGTFDDFKKRLSHNFSRNLTKAHNKLAKLANVKTVFLTGAEATEKDLPRLMKVEASGWKKKEGTAIELSPALVSFYAALAKRFSDLGWLEWHFLECDGRVIAGQMGIKMGRVLTLTKIGYDEEFSYCSPGNILFESVVERAFSSGDTDEINCITDMTWHDNWAVDKRPHYDLWIYPNRPIPLIFGALPRVLRLNLPRVPGIKGIYRQTKKLLGLLKHKS
jgi:CelD/BcsL family acetyltransferase involved in cellulose biosynthesis